MFERLTTQHSQHSPLVPFSLPMQRNHVIGFHFIQLKLPRFGGHPNTIE
jgi:hypothetical protein